MSTTFFKKWGGGIKSYAGSPKGAVVSKLFFLFFVVIGLFASGSLYLLDCNRKSFFLGVVLISFGFVSLVDWFLLFKNYRLIVRSEKFFGGKK